jgi:tetratricopeptide (TPR) repeat protein
MTRPYAAACFTIAVFCGVAVFALRHRNLPLAQLATPEPDRPIPVRPDLEPYEPYRYRYDTAQSIEIFRGRVKRDPQDYASRTTLGMLHMQRSKETGDGTEIDRAAEQFEAALKQFPKYTRAKIARLHALNAKHRFAEALSGAETLLKDESDDPELRVIVFDASLELGDYDKAEATLRGLEKDLDNPVPPSLMARRARLLELRGDPDAAIALLGRAREAERESEATRVSLAWYSSRIAEILFAQGKPDAAQSAIEAAIRDNPGAPGQKVILARVRIAQGKPKESLAILDELLKADREVEAFVAKAGTAPGELKSLANSQNFDTYLLLGDALAAAGDPAKAKDAYAMADRKVDREPPVAVRELILSFCDRDHRLPFALELAANEAKARRDVESCDSLAWALFKNGKLPEAEKAATDALRLGTKDAIIHYHAGVVAHALKKADRAKELLANALRMNPHLSAAHVAHAKRLLAE